jgi:hypothetical protein
LPSAIGAGLKLNSIALISVHALAAPPESEPPGSDDRSATLDVVLSARFITALVTAFVTAFVTALTALFTALVDELLITRKFPLARDTSANPAARDKIPSKIRRRLRADDPTGEDEPLETSRERRVSMRYPLLELKAQGYRVALLSSIALWCRKALFLKGVARFDASPAAGKPQENRLSL